MERGKSNHLHIVHHIYQSLSHRSCYKANIKIYRRSLMYQSIGNWIFKAPFLGIQSIFSKTLKWVSRYASDWRTEIAVDVNLFPFTIWLYPMGRGYSNCVFFFFFWRRVWPQVWNPHPFLRILSPQKMADFTGFFSEIFTNQDPFLKGFLLQKQLILQIFAILVIWNPLLRIFFD